MSTTAKTDKPVMASKPAAPSTGDVYNAIGKIAEIDRKISLQKKKADRALEKIKTLEGKKTEHLPIVKGTEEWADYLKKTTAKS